LANDMALGGIPNNFSYWLGHSNAQPSSWDACKVL